MSYIDFDKYWLGINEAETPAPAATAIMGVPQAGDPYEYKKEGDKYFTRKKGETSWKSPTGDATDPATPLGAIVAKVTFPATPADSTTPAANTAASAASTLGSVAKGTGDLEKIQRPEWLKMMLAQYPYVKVDTDSVKYYDDKGALRYVEDLKGKVMFNYSLDDDLQSEFDPAKKTADIQDNPLHAGAKTTPAATTPAPAATTPAATTPAPAKQEPTAQEKAATLKQEVKDLRQENRAQNKAERKENRAEKKVERLTKDKERLEKKTNESTVYSFGQFLKNR